MPYYADNDDDVTDFDDYDPTPYDGGYDITLTYGRPLPPSDETCYPSSSASDGDFDYARPKFSSHSEPSAYADEALNNEYSSYARPKPRPGFVPGSGGGSGYGGRPQPQPAYGFQPGMGRPEPYGSGRPESEYASGYAKRPDSQEYGSGYGKRPESEEYGSGYGRKPDSESGESGFGGRTESEYGGSAYGRKPEYESGYGQKPEYESGYGGKPGYESGYGSKPEFESGYGRKPEYESGYGISMMIGPAMGVSPMNLAMGVNPIMSPGMAANRSMNLGMGVSQSMNPGMVASRSTSRGMGGNLNLNTKAGTAVVRSMENLRGSRVMGGLMTKKGIRSPVVMVMRDVVMMMNIAAGLMSMAMDARRRYGFEI
ncbi:hypothetical protein CISIN_1g017568mg [Citrus sinensis]|uniref:Uncharacterized protein n=1 Tax=Citrus sinensis TaxID=2711 RepID=A0A067D1R6_CITSI|nr:hypothetical protein CISIN_1g017568mg [Citrus sinensis]